MLRPFDNFFAQQDEPIKSCLQFLRAHILHIDEHITESWKYKMPFFCYCGKMFCYLWVHKKQQQPYIGIVNGSLIHHPDLITGKRAKMKILLLDAATDLPMDVINIILKMAITLYQ